MRVYTIWFTRSLNINNTNLISNTQLLGANNENLTSNTASLNGNTTALNENTSGLSENTTALNSLTDTLNNDDSDGEINSKLSDSFLALKNSLVGGSHVFNNSGSTCPTWTFDESAMLVGGLSIDSHCFILEQIKPIISPLMIVFFSIIGFRTVFSA